MMKVNFQHMPITPFSFLNAQLFAMPSSIPLRFISLVVYRQIKIEPQAFTQTCRQLLADAHLADLRPARCSVLSHNKKAATSTHANKFSSCFCRLFCSARSYSSSLYPMPQIVLIISPFSPILLLSFFTWVSMVLASPK